MSWIGVITDVGRTLLSQYVSGGATINIDRITVGSGTVSEESMREAVNLTYYRDTGTIVSKSDVSHGVDFELQISPCATGAYIAREIGMWANAEGEDPVLLALFQNRDGVDIPAESTNPDFAYIISAILAIDNLDNLTITVDSTAFVPYAVFNPYRASVAAALDGKVDKVEGKGLSEADFTSAEKLKLAGIEANANKYVLPAATTSALGGVKVGTGLGVDANGNLRNAGVRAVETGSANGTISVNTDGTATDVPVKGLGTAAYRDASSLANASHTHNAADINSGTLPVARGGTGITSNPSALTNLGSDSAASLFASAPRPGVTGTLPLTHGGTGATSAAGARTSIGAAAANHTHGAGDIVSGTLPVGRGGTGITSNPSMLTNLGSTSAASVFAASPRPGVTGTLPLANGGTGATTAAGARSNIGAAAASHTHGAGDITSGTLPVARGGTGATDAAGARTNLGAAAASHVHSADNITSGTLPVARGGTGITSNPSMLTNLGSTAAGSVFAASPRPGVTGVLPVANGGTGASNAAGARTNLGIPGGISWLPDTIGEFIGDGAKLKEISLGFKPSKVILLCCLTRTTNAFQAAYEPLGGIVSFWPGSNIVFQQYWNQYGTIQNDTTFKSYLQTSGYGGAAVSTTGFMVGAGDGYTMEYEINHPNWRYVYFAWR